MQARGPLRIEHRLIERMLSVIRKILAEIESKHGVDPVFDDTAVDFIRVYADRTHHGKEEDILFRELNNKQLIFIPDISTKKIKYFSLHPEITGSLGVGIEIRCA